MRAYERAFHQCVSVSAVCRIEWASSERASECVRRPAQNGVYSNRCCCFCFATLTALSSAARCFHHHPLMRAVSVRLPDRLSRPRDTPAGRAAGSRQAGRQRLAARQKRLAHTKAQLIACSGTFPPMVAIGEQ